MNKALPIIKNIISFLIWSIIGMFCLFVLYLSFSTPTNIVIFFTCLAVVGFIILVAMIIEKYSSILKKPFVHIFNKIGIFFTFIVIKPFKFIYGLYKNACPGLTFID